MRKLLLFFILLHISSFPFQPADKKSEQKVVVNAVKTNEKISIDGILSEQVWHNDKAIVNFIQRDPIEGIDATEKSEVRIAYDESYLYVGAVFYDSSPDSIISRMSRRDVGVGADGFTILLDPYNDKRSGYYFAVSSAGTLFDGILYNDDWNDNSWDGVWDAKVATNASGWTAEFQIPFSQVKYHESEAMIWGINLKREIARKNEIDYITSWPKNGSGFVSHFADLIGLENIKASNSIEILPYVTSRSEFTHPGADDPFNSGSEFFAGAGADLKMGIGSNLTLNATINPDFGQVEIDPAVINLSDVETFFSEKRPFFIEGATIFEFGMGGARNYWGFNWPGPDFFYSRRIGRSPQGGTPDADYTDYPDGTHILGAAKLTGKLGESWNVGAIQALTSKEKASYQYEGKTSDVEVEPFTYYGILRAQKEFDGSQHGLGFISTVTSRNFSDDALRSDINNSAFTGGIDGWTFLDSSKTWVIAGWTGFSHIKGTQERITNLQTNSQHYFQRPDLEYTRVDSNATSLTGYAGRIYLNKQKGNFFFNSAVGVLSPEFDVNDIGFISRSDLINMHIGAGYYWEEPTDYYRYMEQLGAIFRSYDFDGNIIWEGLYYSGFIRFLNYYTFNLSAAYNPETTNNRRTRGGPLTINPWGFEIDLYASTDSRKDLIADISGFIYKQPGYSQSWQIDLGVEYRPSSNISISIEPFFSKDEEYSQWVDSFDDKLAAATFGKRYVFGELDQNTFGAGIRLNWTFTPKLSLQLYAQPLISSGKYTNIKELKRPRTIDYLVYGEEGSAITSQINSDDEPEYVVDPDGSGPADEFTFDNPDFNYKSLRGNAVLRWEYMPGSVFYFVWTQTRDDSENIGEFQFNKSVTRLWKARPDNIFMVKFTYWLNI